MTSSNGYAWALPTTDENPNVLNETLRRINKDLFEHLGQLETTLQEQSESHRSELRSLKKESDLIILDLEERLAEMAEDNRFLKQDIISYQDRIQTLNKELFELLTH